MLAYNQGNDQFLKINTFINNLITENIVVLALKLVYILHSITITKVHIRNSNDIKIFKNNFLT